MAEKAQTNPRTIRGHLARMAMAVGLIASLLPAVRAEALPGPAVVNVPEGASKYVAVSPARLADTRNGPVGYQYISANVIRVQVAGLKGVPPDATAAVLNLTAVNTLARGYVTVYPTGVSLPTASNLNIDQPGRVIANMVTVKLGAGGAVDIFHQAPTDLVVDVSGAYVPVREPVADGRLVTLEAGAIRVRDTRDFGAPPPPASTTTLVDLTASGIPADASAVVINLTAVDAATGFWSVVPADQVGVPTTSSLNIDAFPQTRAGQAIVRIVDGQKFIKVYNQSPGHFVVDVAGWFTGATTTEISTDGLFLPTTPTRVLDTRTFVPLIPWKGSTFEFGIGRSTDAVSAAALNLTGVDPWIGGYVTLYPAGQPRPFVSNLNLTTFNQIIANHAIVRVGQRGVDVFTQNGVHLVADVAGWYLGTPSSSPLVKPPNPLYYPNKAASVQIPSLGIWIPIETGPDLDAIATRGHAAAFGDQVDVAEKGNIMLFGHRTSSTHPFLYLNLLKPGQTFMIYGSDGHRYTYMVVRNDITSPNYLTIQNIGTSVAPVTAQLIACHPLHYVYQRIVVTGRLISVD